MLSLYKVKRYGEPGTSVEIVVVQNCAVKPIPAYAVPCFQPPGTWNGTTIAVANGGTGATTHTSNGVLIGNGTSAFTTVAPSTSGNVLTSNGTNWTSSPAPATVREVANEFTASNSQTSFTLTQTPSVNSKVKMFLNGVRISNTAYSFSGTTLTYNPTNNGGYALSAGDRIQFDYYY